VLLVDDGSSDGTADHVESLFGEQVRVIRQENRGPNGARNRGVRESSGEWIAFLDGDDTWVPQKLERQLPYTRQPDIGVISCHSVDEKEEYQVGGPISFEMLWERNYCGVPTTLIRRAALEELGGFDEDRDLVGAEDYNMWLRFAHSRWQVYVVPEELFHYTSAPGSLYSQKERCLKGELLNVQKLGEQLGLDPALLRRKRIDIYRNYGRDFLQLRRMGAARRCLAEELKAAPSAGSLSRWLATFLPVPLLDLRRRLLRTSPQAADDVSQLSTLNSQLTP
jgi:glycosyltransferase involved in cell wall biosynthesis